MKKKIALLANGWSNEIVTDAVEGIRKTLYEKNADLFMFTSHAIFGAAPEEIAAENAVFDLPYMEDFDGAIVFSNILNAEYPLIKEICDKILSKNIPVISIGADVEGAGYVKLDNESGMRDLTKHLYDECKVKRAMFVGGAKEHPDCQARLQILQETAAQHGFGISEEDIFFTSWSYEEGEKIGYQIGENRENLPDVIVCANDYLALAVAAGLFNRGISLPGEILITGFDDVCAGQNFYPSLTTVGQDYKTIGSRACEWIFDRIEGKNVEREISLPSVFVVGESTQGASIEADKRRRIIGQNLYIDDINNSFLESRQAWMESHFLNSRSVEHLRSALIDFYRRGSRYEGSNVSVILEKDFFNSVYEHRINLNEIRRAEEKMVLFAVRDGEELKVSQVDRTEIVPGYNGEDEPHMYIIVPLYVKNFVFGYGILADHNFLLRTRRLMIYFSKVQNALEHFRSNLYVDMVNSELLEISTKDSLTGVYNRLAYTKYVLPMFEQVQQEKQRMVIVFIDVNNMKTINDKYGHLQGDLALKIISEVIKKSIPSEWMALRYGGDEFMIVGKTDSLGNNKGKGAADQIEQLIEEIEKIEKSIWDGIIASAEEMSLPYDLTVSYGYTVSEPDQDKDLNTYVREADVNMYKMKKKLKEKMI